jgi:hypothetical protein
VFLVKPSNRLRKMMRRLASGTCDEQFWAQKKQSGNAGMTSLLGGKSWLERESRPRLVLLRGTSRGQKMMEDENITPDKSQGKPRDVTKTEEL